MGMVDAHPALVASSPQASPSDMFIGDDWHHNGAFRIMYAFSWLARNARRRDVSSQSKTLFPILDDGFRDGFPRGGNRHEGRKPFLGLACQDSDRDELVESTLVCPGSSFAQWSQLGDGLASFGYDDRGAFPYLAEIGAEACLKLSRAHLLGAFSPHVVIVTT